MVRSGAGGRRRLAALTCLALALVAARQARAQPPPSADRAPASYRLLGRVYEAGRRGPLPSVRLTIVPASADERVGRARRPLNPDETPAWSVTAATDAEGKFVVELPARHVRVIVVTEGFDRLDWIVDAAAGPDPKPVALYVARDAFARYRTVVRSQARRDEPLQTRFDHRELETVPGTQGDPLRALQSLPGVARVPAGLGALVMRGAVPGVWIDGHPVPRAFHVLGLASVLGPAVLDDVVLEPTNFGAPWGGTTSGSVRLSTRTQAPAGVHGHAGLDILGASASLTAGHGRNSFIFAGRRSWTDAVVTAANRVAGNLNAFAPGYFDYFAAWNRTMRNGARLTLRSFGEGDRLRDASGRRSFEFRDGFHRIDLDYRVSRPRYELWLTPSLRFDTSSIDQTFLDQTRFGRRRADQVVSWRANLEVALAPAATLVVGTDAIIDRANVRQTGNYQDAGISGATTSAMIGVYVAPQFRFGPVSFEFGGRASAFVLGSNYKAAIDPRLAFGWQAARRVKVRAAIGSYTAVSPSSVFNVSAGTLPTSTQVTKETVTTLPSWMITLFDPGFFAPEKGAGLSVARALHASGSVEGELGWNSAASAAPFVRVVDGGSSVTPDAGGVRGRGLTYGVELLLRRRFGQIFYGWVGYTWLRSQFRRASGVTVPDIFDQRHSFVLVASAALPRNWQIGTRFRVVTGSSYAPVIGSIDSANGATPVFGSFGDARYPVFHQLDLRVDKRWVKRLVEVVAYLDVQNAYNYRYSEVFLYTLDWRERVGGLGLPILPTIGVQVSF